jgi:hypothetical protein
MQLDLRTPVTGQRSNQLNYVPSFAMKNLAEVLRIQGFASFA